MAAYLISEVSVRDADASEAYRTRAAASIDRHGGRYLVRGGPVERLEGKRTPRTVVLVGFPDRERAWAWYCSPEYSEALELRDRALSRNLVLVDGIDATPDRGGLAGPGQ